MADLMDANYETSNHKVALVTTICNHTVVFREIWLTDSEPSHISAYVRLTPPHRSNEEYESYDETYRDDDVFGIDTAHAFNTHQDMGAKLIDAKRQITELIQEHINWQLTQNKIFKVGDKVITTDAYFDQFMGTIFGEVTRIKGELVTFDTFSITHGLYVLNKRWLILDEKTIKKSVEQSPFAKRIMNLEL